MTRPRKRKNADNLSGFTVIDPGENWIRIMAAKAEPDSRETVSRRAKVLQNAVVMGDSHGFDDRAAKILDDALERERNTASAADLVDALAYHAELAVRADDTAAAVEGLDQASAITLSEAERETVSEALLSLDDLTGIVAPTHRP